MFGVVMASKVVGDAARTGLGACTSHFLPTTTLPLARILQNVPIIGLYCMVTLESCGLNLTIVILFASITSSADFLALRVSRFRWPLPLDNSAASFIFLSVCVPLYIYRMR